MMQVPGTTRPEPKRIPAMTPITSIVVRACEVSADLVEGDGRRADRQVAAIHAVRDLLETYPAAGGAFELHEILEAFASVTGCAADFLFKNDSLTPADYEDDAMRDGRILHSVSENLSAVAKAVTQ